MKAAPIDKAAVFEIGCAAGTNLIPMAAQLKNAKFTGIDLSEKQIETGKNLIAKAGLKNIDLACRNIM
jgi:cyclopropane fatty-acyl-phospholipid synthase-like methyltransferase